MNPRNLFAELKRRNVYKVAVAYAVVSWLLMQIASQIFPFFEIPNWAVRLVVLVLIIGFPVALILAWAYEVTPEGIKRAEEVDLGKSITRRTGRKLDFLIIGVLLLVIAVFAYQRFWPAKKSSGAAAEKSIAVLPFENLSRDPDNAYFAEGVQDEILTRLSKVADLKVISRTSTQHYKSAPENLPEIGRQLGVAHIVEGNVQKSGDSVRVNVQLIRASNDSHLWAETFDRKLTDIFAVESEVAKAIADQLRAKITGQEERLVAAKPTDNPEAYDAYLRGLVFHHRGATPDNVIAAQKYLQQAVKLDSSFATAWALLAQIDATGYALSAIPPTAQLREEARTAAENAVSLQPSDGESYLAKGYYEYECLRNYDTAISYFEKARAVLPNDSEVPLALAYVTRRRGELDRSVAYFSDAEKLSPRDVNLLTQFALTYIARRQFAESARKLDQVLDIVPGEPDATRQKAPIAMAQGDLPKAASLLASVPQTNDFFLLKTQAYLASLQRNPGTLIQRLREALALPDSPQLHLSGNLQFLLGWLQKISGDASGAHETWIHAREELEAMFKQQQENPFLIANLSFTYAGLGEKKLAIATAEQGVRMHPIEKDIHRGGVTLDALGRTLAMIGDADAALPVIERLLTTRYSESAFNVPLTPAILSLDPMFDPLRNDPRFQKLASGR